MLKTAESVSVGHPDKVCDQISDAILDACLAQDPKSRVAIETMGGHGIISITGELTTSGYVNMRKIAQEVYKDCGYDENIGVNVNVVEQSPEIGAGVDQSGGQCPRRDARWWQADDLDRGGRDDRTHAPGA